MWKIARYGLIRTGIALFLVVPELYAQPQDVQRQMADVLRYTGVEKPAPDDVARMAELWTRAQQSGLGREERRLAVRDMFVLYASCTAATSAPARRRWTGSRSL